MTTTSRATGWISARHLQHVLVRGDRAGVRMDDLLAEAGLSRAQLGAAEGLVPVAAVEALLGALSRRVNEPLLGLRLADDVQPATFGALGHLVQTCETVGDVLSVAARYNGLLSDVGVTTLHVAGERAELRWECRAGSDVFRRHAAEYVLAAFAALLRALVSERGPLLERVRFAHAAPREPVRRAEYEDRFRCEVSFDEPVSALVLPTRALAARLRHGDAELRAALERHAQELLRRRAERSTLAEAVRRLVEATLPDGTPTKDVVAARLGLSARSLHRKLHAQGTGYRRIVDQVRLERAKERLRESDDAVESIAGGLGFSTPQAFLRWFRQCTGTTPGVYRKRSAAPLAR